LREFTHEQSQRIQGTFKFVKVDVLKLHGVPEQHPITFLINNKGAVKGIPVFLQQLFEHPQIVFPKGEEKLLHNKDWRRNAQNQIVDSIRLIVDLENAMLFILIEYFTVKPECEIFDGLKVVHGRNFCLTKQIYRTIFTIAKKFSIVIIKITIIFEEMTKIGANIKKIRTTKGLSQQAFADLFTLTRGNISSYEENRAEPRIETVMQIANYFGIPLNQFITQSLFIHEILKYNGDKLLGDENHIINLQLRQVPFINDAIYMKCYQELSFTDLDSFPKLVLPEVKNHTMLALSFNPNISHHESLPQYQLNDVLIFEEVTRQNIHLCQQKTGLFTSEREIMVGRYEMKDEKLDLVLNDFKKERFDFNLTQRFWKLFATYQHEK